MTSDSEAGRMRRLQALSSPAGVFRILAIDHRRVLLKMMDPDARVTAERVTRLKLDIAHRIGPYATAVILDQEFSLIPAITNQTVPATVGLLVSLDGQRREDPMDVAVQVQRACRVGASAVKLYLAYCHMGSMRDAQERLVREVIEACHQEGMPLFLEPVLRTTDASASDESVALARQRRSLSMMMVQRLGALGPDVLKLQFPVDPRHEPNEAVWCSACAELNDASPVPWGLLSGGESFEIFKTQLQVACESGASGFMAGRSVWSEAVTAPEEARTTILTDLTLPRFQELTLIATHYARGWHARAPASSGASMSSRTLARSYAGDPAGRVTCADGSSDAKAQAHRP